MTFRIRNGVDLADDAHELLPRLVVGFGVQDDLALGLLSLLDPLEVLLHIDCVGHKSAGIGLDEHQFKYVELLECDPVLVELLEVHLDV